MDTSEKIRFLRTQRGLSLQDVADAVGVNKSTVKRWEDGVIYNMGIDKLKQVAEVLGVTPAYLMGWEDESGELVRQLRFDLHDNPDLLTLLDLGRGCSKAEMKQIIAIVKAYKGDYND